MRIMSPESKILEVKYEPKSLADCVLSPNLRKLFTTIVEKNSPCNMLFHGTSGLGKTTLVKVLTNELNMSALFINGSKDSGIDVLRNTIENFVTSKALSGKRKVVIIDEADFLNANTTQPALRGFIDKYQSQVPFFFTCNYVNRLTDHIVSRCQINVDFSEEYRKNDKFLKKETSQRIIKILTDENIPFRPDALKQVILDNFPDHRAILGACQKLYNEYGEIGDGAFAHKKNSYEEIFRSMKNKDYSEVRRWSINCDPSRVYTDLANEVFERVKPEFVPYAIKTIGTWQYRSAFSVDKALAILSCITDIMFEVEFK
jgi:DNA polymerase III delta prime subunit